MNSGHDTISMVSAGVGDGVGNCDGDRVGNAVGVVVGTVVGAVVVADADGARVVGGAVGTPVGLTDGTSVGASVDTLVGLADGGLVGESVGTRVGLAVGDDVTASSHRSPSNPCGHTHVESVSLPDNPDPDPSESPLSSYDATSPPPSSTTHVPPFWHVLNPHGSGGAGVGGVGADVSVVLNATAGYMSCHTPPGRIWGEVGWGGGWGGGRAFT
jgi:hypothetical protein